MHFSEDLLHFVWQFRLFEAANLLTSNGEVIEILNCGLLNKNAGPDFTNAKIRIGETIWVGNVEIHIKSSDWNKHNHQIDEAYENVILHVVFDDDETIFRKNGVAIPTLALGAIVATSIFKKYDDLIANANNFPCEPLLKDVDSFIVDQFLSRVLVERLAEKADEVFTTLDSLNGNWEETFYHYIAKNFGFKINALPMQMLAQSLPQTLFAKHKDQYKQIEALVFGQAGWLNQNFEEHYPKTLKVEYEFLRKKYTLVPIDVSLWKFLRMRPQNFPTLRLAQFAAFVQVSTQLFSKILAVKNVEELRLLFEILPVNTYWKNHYHFGQLATNVTTQLGTSSVDNILINTVALFLFAYGKYTGFANFQTRAFYLLESIKPEQNIIVKQYVNAGATIVNAYQTQGLLQLRKRYCNEKKCLKCGIGLKILKKTDGL